MNIKKFVSCLIIILLLILTHSIVYKLGHDNGYYVGFHKHHSQVYIKYEGINRSLFSNMKKVGIPYTAEQAQALVNLIKIEKR